MTRFELIAVLDENAAAAGLRALASGPARASSQAVRAAGLAGILTAQSASLWRTRKRLGQALVDRQRGLEALHAVADVLPAAPGGGFAAQSEAEAFLTANAAVLRDALTRYGPVDQHQILIELDPRVALERAKAGPDWVRVEQAAKSGSRAEAGAAAAAAGEAVRATLAAAAARALEPIAAEMVELPLGEAHHAYNTAVVTPKGQSAALDAALEALDAAWDGAPRIRLIGPAPAISFASVHVAKPAAREVAEAARTLGVTRDADAATIRAAFKEVVRAAHPDRAGPEGAQRTQLATAAEALLTQLAEARAALSAAGRAAAEPPALAALRRDGQAI